MDLKNITMDDLKQKLAAVDKKTLIKFGSGFGAIILFLIIYYVILNPMVKERKAKYNDKIAKQNEISQFDNEIITFKSRIKEMKPDFDKTSTLFHSKAEVEDLYESLSKYAAVNGLVISKIEKKKPKPVFKQGVTQQAENNITMDMQNKMLNFDKETISIVQNDSTGAIMAQGELTIVGLPDEFF